MKKITATELKEQQGDLLVSCQDDGAAAHLITRNRAVAALLVSPRWPAATVSGWLWAEHDKLQAAGDEAGADVVARMAEIAAVKDWAESKP